MRRHLAAVAALVLGTGAAVALPAAPASAAECNAQIAQWARSRPAPLMRMNADLAWTQATGRGVVVAVVDSGVDQHNKHLTDALVPGKSFVPGVPATQDDAGHGTAIAGEIAARHVDGSGVLGLSPDAKIMPVRVFFGADDRSRAAGAGPRADRMAAGIRWAADHGADVINVSMSTPQDSPDLRDAVTHATAEGALVVASAGNRSTAQDKSDGVRYPGGYPQAMAVAATDSWDQVTNDSIHGPHVDIAAPGTNVLTSYFGAGDCLISAASESTSFATGYVSAAAALVAQKFPHEGPAAWKRRLEQTAARERRSARDDRAGWGVVQPYEALTAAVTKAGPPPRAQTGSRPLGLAQFGDPHAPERTAALWWSLGGLTALLGLALVGMLRRPQGGLASGGRRRAGAARG